MALSAVSSSMLGGLRFCVVLAVAVLAAAVVVALVFVLAVFAAAVLVAAAFGAAVFAFEPDYQCVSRKWKVCESEKSKKSEGKILQEYITFISRFDRRLGCTDFLCRISVLLSRLLGGWLKNNSRFGSTRWSGRSCSRRLRLSFLRSTRALIAFTNVVAVLSFTFHGGVCGRFRFAGCRRMSTFGGRSSRLLRRHDQR